jgi:hypothetical protein
VPNLGVSASSESSRASAVVVVWSCDRGWGGLSAQFRDRAWRLRIRLGRRRRESTRGHLDYRADDRRCRRRRAPSWAGAVCAVRWALAERRLEKAQRHAASRRERPTQATGSLTGRAPTTGGRGRRWLWGSSSPTSTFLARPMSPRRNCSGRSSQRMAHDNGDIDRVTIGD